MYDELNYTAYRQYMAKTLLRLVEEHKVNCKNQDCKISLYCLSNVYEELRGRKITKTELEKFM